jgi:transcriptional regulator with XRE-family HTH domain
MPRNRTTAQKITAARTAAGLTIYRLTQQADLSKNYLARVESGEIPEPSLPMLRRIAGALGVDCRELVGD